MLSTSGKLSLSLWRRENAAGRLFQYPPRMGLMSWMDGILGLTEDQWIYVGFMGSALAWTVVLTV